MRRWGRSYEGPTPGALLALNRYLYRSWYCLWLSEPLTTMHGDSSEQGGQLGDDYGARSRRIWSLIGGGNLAISAGGWRRSIDRL